MRAPYLLPPSRSPPPSGKRRSSPIWTQPKPCTKAWSPSTGAGAVGRWRWRPSRSRFSPQTECSCSRRGMQRRPTHLPTSWWTHGIAVLPSGTTRTRRGGRRNPHTHIHAHIHTHAFFASPCELAVAAEKRLGDGWDPRRKRGPAPRCHGGSNALPAPGSRHQMLSCTGTDAGRATGRLPVTLSQNHLSAAPTPTLLLSCGLRTRGRRRGRRWCYHLSCTTPRLWPASRLPWRRQASSRWSSGATVVSRAAPSALHQSTLSAYGV